jgi:hypothetical protein
MPESHLRRQAKAPRLQPDEEFHDHRVPIQGMEIDEAPIEGDAVPFPGEDAVMMIFWKAPLTGDAPWARSKHANPIPLQPLMGGTR